MLDLKKRREARRAANEAHEAYERARAEAAEHGRVVCTYVDADGKPSYFTVEPTVTNDEVQKRAFELKNGRAMSALERDLLAIAARIGKS